MSIKVPKIVRAFGSIFHEHDLQCYLVGGAVRNLIRRDNLGDFDIATDAKPEEVGRLFRRVIPTGLKHGTVTVIFKGQTFEVTTFRADGVYTDGRRPESVVFVPTLAQDLERRDFTINSIAVQAIDGTVVDPNGGIDDLKRGVIRAIGDPDERFSEDGLRLMRACRFAAQLEFSIEEGTLKSIGKCAENIKSISNERIRDELDKMLLSPHPSVGLRIMESTGLLELVLPELAQTRGVEQDGNHDFDVFEHSLHSCDAAPRENTTVRLAALLHDTGKAGARQVIDGGVVVFYGHEELSEMHTRTILGRLKYSNKQQAQVCHLVRHHMFSYDNSWTDAAVRRFIRRVHLDAMDDLFALRMADAYGMKNKPVSGENLLELGLRIQKVTEEESALSLRDLKIDGNELYSIAGIPKGPEMGIVLSHLLEAVLDDPALNNRESLLHVAKRFYQFHISKSAH